jgi:NitT/TauT family transport system permease protein
MSDTAIEVGLQQAPAAARRGRNRVLRVAAPILVAIGLICLWEIYVKVGHVSHFLVPTPTAVFGDMIHQQHLLLPLAWITVKEMLEGFVIAMVGGVLVGLLIVAFRPAELTVYPILVGSQVIPKIAIAPVILLLFGLGHTSRIIIIVSLAFFPVVISTVVGLKSLEVTKIYLARSLGAGKIEIFRKFRFPQALPDIFAGLKLGATRAVGAALIAEFMTPGPGLGRIILLGASELHPELALACVGYMVVIGLTLFFIVTKAEQLTTPWHQTTRDASR